MDYHGLVSVALAGPDCPSLESGDLEVALKLRLVWVRVGASLVLTLSGREVRPRLACSKMVLPLAEHWLVRVHWDTKSSDPSGT